MHNLLSYNQLAEWKLHSPVLSDALGMKPIGSSDYFDLVQLECDEEHNTCKRICRSILSSHHDR